MIYPPGPQELGWVRVLDQDGNPTDEWKHEDAVEELSEEMKLREALYKIVHHYRFSHTPDPAVMAEYAREVLGEL